MGASLVGWFSFDRVGDVQSKVNDGSVPELAASFGVAQFAGLSGSRSAAIGLGRNAGRV